MNDDATHGKLKYKVKMQRVANFESEVIQIELGDLEEHFRGDPSFVNRIKINTKRYISLFGDVIEQLMPAKNVNVSEDIEDSASNILYRQRRDNIEYRSEKLAQSYMTEKDPYNCLPPELRRKYFVYIVRGPNDKRTDLKLREIHAETIGGLVSFRAIVTKASEIRPCIEVACYSCEA